MQTVHCRAWMTSDTCDACCRWSCCRKWSTPLIKPEASNTDSARHQNCCVSYLLSFSSVAVHTPCLKKTVQNCFCQNFGECPPVLIIFGRKMAKKVKLCEVYSFSTSPNLHHHTTMLNADVPNCYTTL